MNQAQASTLNPFAGSHPVTASAAEVEAAVRAADASLRAFAYYRARYGQRGRLFGRSDGAWLVGLCHGGDDAHVHEQVLWLGRVLASRGMPRWLLERHLEVLHRELVRASPPHAGRYAVLLDAARMLARRREARIPAAEAAALADAFLARADPTGAEGLPEMGRILVAAAADEADGIVNAVSSVAAWAADGSRFSGRWTAAVEDTLSVARSRCSSSSRT